MKIILSNSDKSKIKEKIFEYINLHIEGYATIKTKRDECISFLRNQGFSKQEADIYISRLIELERQKNIIGSNY